MNPKQWLLGLLHATISGAANSITGAIAMPDQVNLSTPIGLKHAMTLGLVGAFIGFWLFLKQSPIPTESSTVTSKVITQGPTVTKTEETKVEETKNV